MKNPSDSGKNREELWGRLIGLGEHSARKSYYPELQQRLGELERFRALLDNSNDLIFLLEVPSGIIIDVNESACRQMGFPRQKLLGLSFFDRTDRNSDQELEQIISLDQPAALGRKVVCTLYASDGTPLPAEVTLSRVILEDGEYVAAIARDISERMLAEKTLRESEEKFRLLLNSTAEAIYGLDTEGKCIFCNLSCIKMLGYERESDLLRKNIHELIHHHGSDGTEYPEEECRIYQAFRKGEGVHVDDEVLWRADGSSFDVEYWSYPMRTGEEVVGSVVTFLDITQRKRAEEALRESDRIKTEFIRTVAHEFRTPLTSIQGFSDLLLSHDQLSPEERKEFLGYIHERSAALAELVRDILDIARIEAGKGLSLKVSPCPVKDIYRQVEPFLKTQTSRHRIEVELTEETTLLKVDKGKIGQVLENLLSNAVKFSPKGSMLHIRGDRMDEGYRFSVADQGIGMTPEQMARVFDKFYRADASDTAVEGIGLGMHIVKHIVESHGGKIRIESESGKGTTVSFTVPLAR